jgi:hypothetical protein
MYVVIKGGDNRIYINSAADERLSNASALLATDF